MQSRSDGYIYVPAVADGPLSSASTGSVVRLDKHRPPWLVVAHSLESVSVPKWPGKLFEVTVINKKGIEQVSKQSDYTRAAAVQFGDEVPASRLFGEHGDGVCSVLARAVELNVDDVRALAEARHPAAEQAYKRAWQKWLNETQSASDYRAQNLAAARGIGPPRKRSPIHSGFAVLHGIVRDRAELLVGRSVIEVDAEGEEYLEPTWASACNTLVDAAMAMGAPELSGTEDRSILLAAWRKVFGDSEHCTP